MSEEQTEVKPEITPPTAKLGPIERIIGTLISPSETFKDIGLVPGVIVPVILSIIISLGSTAIILYKLDVKWEALYEKVFSEQLEKQGKSYKDLPPDQKEQFDNQIKAASKVAPYLSYISPMVSSIAVPMILALIFYGGVTLMGGQTQYKKVFSLVSHIFCTVTLAIQLSLNVLIVFIKDPSSFDLTKGTLITTNPGMLLPAGSNKALVAALTQIDIFTIWALILLTIGLPAISKNLSRGFATAIVFGLWGVYAAVAILLKILFS